MAKYSVGDKVSFHRNPLIHSDSTFVHGIVKKISGLPQMYVIESTSGHGWNADAVRKKMFGLKDGKIYLFVKEDELLKYQTKPSKRNKK